MCAPDAAIYINIDLTFSVVRSIKIPISHISTIAATNDTPVWVIQTEGNQGVDQAEIDILSCLFLTNEDKSPDLSNILQMFKSRVNVIHAKQRGDLETTGHPHARTTWQPRSGDGTPKNGTGVHIEFDQRGQAARLEGQVCSGDD